MAKFDVGLQRRALLVDADLQRQIPLELLGIVTDPKASNLLDAVAVAALIPQLTGSLFVYFEDVFPDICARWVQPRDGQSSQVVAAFARILPFAPYVSTLLETYLQRTSGGQVSRLACLDEETQDEVDLQRSLVAVWRLLSFDKKTFARLVSPSRMDVLMQHSCQPVRCLAVRIFCQLLDASDAKLKSMLGGCDEGQSVQGDFDGETIDYALLTLCEKERAKEIARRQKDFQMQRGDASDFPLQELTPFVLNYGTALLPLPNGPQTSAASLVQTPTTTANLEGFARLLRQPDPILLHGPAGSGKTSMVHQVSRDLGMEDKMITLHLNEQTDAKVLIGLYATGSKPGSFQWRPGVLTTAVKEGRWVLIEDLDRAPNEIMSTLLPLIERRELLIAGRGERIVAPSGFRLFATIRTSKDIHDAESIPNLLGMRFWQPLQVRVVPQPELKTIIKESHPVLHRLVEVILSVYNSVSSPRSLAGCGSERIATVRDLLKWCRRLAKIMEQAGCKTGSEPINETVQSSMFAEAVDCFAGSVQDEQLKAALTREIAREMHVSPQRADHFLEAYTPRMEETDAAVAIGRVALRKRANRVSKQRKPFASTSHAKRLLEQMAAAVRMAEPVLLVGETGIGKTTVVQQLADTLGHRLVAVNLSQQSEVGDLLGGFKPVNVRSLAIPLKDEFDDLFRATGISTSKNQKYLEQIGKSAAKGQWSRVSRLWREAPRMFASILDNLSSQPVIESRDENGQRQKRRKTESRLQSLLGLKPRWDSFARSLDQFDIQLPNGTDTFAFAFVEGNLVKAVRNGDWVLLDELNLASPDTLESIADLLHSGTNGRPSILLSETGEIDRVEAHPDFRMFGAMNPATDVGKRDLPLGIRSRFTEIFVQSPDRDLQDLLTIIKTYLRGNSSKDNQAADDIARLYINTKRLADEKRIVDGANEAPHFSLRTLARVLMYVNDVSPYYGLRRSLFEGFSMGFLTLLDQASEKMVTPLIHHHLFKQGDSQSVLSQKPKYPTDGKEYVGFSNKNRDRQYWLLKGEEKPMDRPDYIVTPSVERNLLNLVRATSTRRFPILIQGPTSSGKTSMIQYLANFSGNVFVRINNHEHTDLQEYLGTYVSDSEGKLRFQDGLLVQAMRKGHWIVLDELNLAPTDVLEALNRLLDDNRELLIPETQEVVRPHDGFMLFATQNPPGLYGGRKVLSRAFRNRFLELHFDDIPEDELEHILQRRSVNTSPSDCARIVAVYKELSRLRQASRVFEQKDSFATLRDLFRWALRRADHREQIANNGYMLLAERVRNQDERVAVKEVIESVFKVKISPERLYDAASPHLERVQTGTSDVVWTYAMRRLFVLVSNALANNEPVLLVGETGCGKTTVCQLLAAAAAKELHTVNAHQNTETGDLIGSQRPVRNRAATLDALRADLLLALGEDVDGPEVTVELLLEMYHGLSPEMLNLVPQELRHRIKTGETRNKALFEWADGGLVHALKQGSYFLLDEISLADDSVLERLNSVLEPHRSLLLAEKGTDGAFVEAQEGFQFLATMNPGGDYGKKELSPALRNRFTEIWVPPLSEHADILEIVVSKLVPHFRPLSQAIVDFAYWFGKEFRAMSSTAFSIRDMLVWVSFINGSALPDPDMTLLHGAATVFIDTLGANPSALLSIDLSTLDVQRRKCLEKLGSLIHANLASAYGAEPDVVAAEDGIEVGGFRIPRAAGSAIDTTFAFHAPTTKLNLMRVVRALQINKPILLEGSPGVGKTTLVAALAAACGRPLTRINLSDQTDLMDLFGTDVPVEGAAAGVFAWRDAPFLTAMQTGGWVLLDEMNLAPQTVLEGLNACLDHRAEVYVAELDRSFRCHPDFRLFAAQNPHHQGGGRKGLPASFVNRFVVVYADVFQPKDLRAIARHAFPDVLEDTVDAVIAFIARLEHEVATTRSIGAGEGAPWEFNLRDILRWLALLSSPDPLFRSASPEDFFPLVVSQRFRTVRDRAAVSALFARVFNRDVAAPPAREIYHRTAADFAQVGLATLQRGSLVSQPTPAPRIDITQRLPELESLLICARQNLPCILAGPAGCGKSALIRHAAALAGKETVVFPLNADVDATDLVGGFDQMDPARDINATLRELEAALREHVLTTEVDGGVATTLGLLQALDAYFAGETPLASIADLVSRLGPTYGSNAGIRAITATFGPLYEQTLRHASSAAAPRFEWLDGAIVHALRRGAWLVLDNANLCSASALDRLNSLLEPGGRLLVNEHSGPGGEPTVVEPHPEFRVFLTVDPRYGELSRAMRNRAVEIYLGPLQKSAEPWESHVAAVDPDVAACDAAVGLAGAVGNTDLVVTGLLGRPDVGHAESCGALVKKTHAAAQKLADSAARYRRVLDAVPDYASHVRASLPAGDADWPTMGTMIERTAHHPLQNALLLRLQPDDSRRASLLLAASMDHLMRAFGAQETILAESHRPAPGRPSDMSRFQRSLRSQHIASAAKDSTAAVAPFLDESLRAVVGYLQTFAEDAGKLKSAQGSEFFAVYHDHSLLLRSILQLLLRLFSVAGNTPFNDVLFQAYLTQGRKLLELQRPSLEIPPCGPLVHGFLGLLDRSFVSGFKLSHGLSMEVLWATWKPTPIYDERRMREVMQLEAMAAKFDAIRWRLNARPDDHARVVAALTKAYGAVRTGRFDAAGLLEPLAAELAALERSVGDGPVDHLPFLAQEFEALRQLLALHKAGAVAGETAPGWWHRLVVLSNQPTVAEMRLLATTDTSAPLHRVSYLVGGAADQPWSGRRLSPLVRRRLQAIAAADLTQLQSLELELPLMAKVLARESHTVEADHVAALNDTLWRLLQQLVAVHSDRLRDDVVALYDRLRRGNVDAADLDLAGYPDHVTEIMADHILPAVGFLADSTRHAPAASKPATLAWTHFVLACVRLYVPDKLFDPQLSARTERDFHRELCDAVQADVEAARKFNSAFFGQEDSVRSNLLADELEVLPEPPPESAQVYRPPPEKLPALQAEFSNTLRAVLGSDIVGAIEKLGGGGEESDGARQHLALVQANLVQMIARLSTNFAAFEDLAAPLVDVLCCLQLAISLQAGHATPDADAQECLRALASVTPFAGGRLANLDAALADPSPAYRAEYLALLGALASVDGTDGMPPAARRLLHRCTHSLYEQWSLKLDADKKTEEARQSLYRFRGSLEDEEELDADEFDELFPSDAGEDDEKPRKGPKPNDVRILAVKVAAAHRAAVLVPTPPQDAIRTLLLAVTSRIANAEDADALVPGTALLPGTFLALSDHVASIQTPGVPASYSFYTTPNLSESRRLAALVHAIRARFLALRQVDEIAHLAPLAEVVHQCAKVLATPHAAPLALAVPRVELLHAAVYEWQFGGWASAKAYGVGELYDSLTNLLVDWRRQELATWGRLFDAEERACEDDARSWWFVAYEVVVAVPLAMAQRGEDGELPAYAVNLLNDLQRYFAAALLGQFAARLALLRQLRRHLQILAADHPGLGIVEKALAGFVTYYARFEKGAHDAIREGRRPLEKQIKDIVLMASWRDTNIAALRESAKRSHLKLFRVVRKFRGVLGRSVADIVDRGVPAAGGDAGGEALFPAAATLVQPDAPSLDLVRQRQPAVSSRLANLPTTLTVMKRLGALPPTAATAADEVDSYLTSLDAAAAELRKETPPTLSDDNKALVAHLRLRKRRLLAAALRELRRMGFRHNLGAAALGGQDNLAKVVAGVAGFEGFGEARYQARLDAHLHHLLDLAPKVRAAAHAHSDDLTRAEVHRGLGFMEGLLHAVLAQRARVAAHAKNLDALAHAAGRVQAICAAGREGELVRGGGHGEHTRPLKWLLEVLKFAVGLVETHAKLGELDNSGQLHSLRRHLQVLQELAAEQTRLGKLPNGISSTRHAEVEARTTAALADLQAELGRMGRDREDLDFVLAQVRLWTAIPAKNHDSTTAPPTNLDLSQILPRFSQFTDTVLVAVERYSKAASQVPASTDHRDGYVTAHDAALDALLHSAQVPRVAAALDHLVDAASAVSLDDARDGATLHALFAAVDAVLSRYLATCRDSTQALATLHLAAARLAAGLTATFHRLASEGFCSPREASDDAAGDKEGKLEGGTGLGDGEGAQDISKDVQDDEDLSELAKEGKKEDGQDDGDGIEDEKDAVDMADEDLEGELASVGGEEDEGGEDKEGDEDEEGDDMDDEAGDVDDLDPNAVDEKMWEGGDDEESADKEQKGDKAAGKAEKEKAAGEQQDKQPEDDVEVDEQGDGDEEDADDDEAQLPENNNMQDQNVAQTDTLALPEDMELDGDEQGDDDDDGDDDDVDELDEAEQDEAAEKDVASDGEDARGEDQTHAADIEVPDAADDMDGESDEGEEEDEAGELQVDTEEQTEEPVDQDAEKSAAEVRTNDDTKTAQDAVSSDVRDGGQDESGDPAAADHDEQDDQQAPDNLAKRDNGDNSGQAADERDQAAGREGLASRRDDNEPPPREEADQEQQPAQEEAVADPFKKLGDELEKWYRARRDIQAAPQEPRQQMESRDDNADAKDIDLATQDFQHLPDDGAAADAQALGAVGEEDARPWGDPMALEDDEETRPLQGRDEEDDDDEQDQDDPMAVDDDDDDRRGRDEPLQPGVRSGVQTLQGGLKDESGDPQPDDAPDPKATDADSDSDSDPDVAETSSHLSATHLTRLPHPAPPAQHVPPRDFASALRLWTRYQARTHAQSVALAAQLRLVLAPTQSTKLAGGHRTGKRLAIKKIIPYIASGYRRDKIWLRRAVPTKRRYQILVCVDDSRSMREAGAAAAGADAGSALDANAAAGGGGGGATLTNPPPTTTTTTTAHKPGSTAGSMALESLVMLSRALGMAEAGQVGVLGFGGDVFTAHPLTTTAGGGGDGAAATAQQLAAPDAGARALQHFGFAQQQTDVAGLLRAVLDQFRTARTTAQGGGSGGGGGGDLWQLALILSDGITPRRQHAALARLLREAAERRVMAVFVMLEGGGRGRVGGGDSVLDLKEARFEKDEETGATRVVIERYLDSFPFRYYLVVHDLAELPAALAGVLSTWFTEVNA